MISLPDMTAGSKAIEVFDFPQSMAIIRLAVDMQLSSLFTEECLQ